MSQLSAIHTEENLEHLLETSVPYQAPLRFYSELLVDHSPLVVWSFFSDLAKWTAWSPICRGCRLGDDQGELQLGSLLEIKFAVLGFNLTVPCRVVQFDPPHLITWQGQKFGIRAIHRYGFIPRANGTLLCNEEMFSGAGFPLNQLLSVWYRASKLSSQSLAGIKRELARGERS